MQECAFFHWGKKRIEGTSVLKILGAGQHGNRPVQRALQTTFHHRQISLVAIFTALNPHHAAKDSARPIRGGCIR
jgi:hypothetical protein